MRPPSPPILRLLRLVANRKGRVISERQLQLGRFVDVHAHCTCRGGGTQNAEYNEQGQRLRQRKPIAKHHLHAYEGEHNCETRLQVFDIVQGFSQQQIQRSQAEDGEHVRAEDEEEIVRKTEDAWNGIDCKNEVTQLHNNESREHGRSVCLSTNELDELMALRPCVVGDDGSHCAHHPRVASSVVCHPVILLFLLAVHLPCRIKEQRPEGVDHAVHVLQKPHAREHENESEDHRTQNAPLQDGPLVVRLDVEALEYQSDNDEVVDAEALLDEVTGDEDKADLPTLVDPEKQRERQREADPCGARDHRPADCMPRRHELRGENVVCE
mmetsp:Transcript_85663/g.239339  ORF Transcript_85663/g.239339 Transcript_85663/m.239339 type:complete len:326 (+) Transcript_85663:118-1095(+)